MFKQHLPSYLLGFGNSSSLFSFDINEFTARCPSDLVATKIRLASSDCSSHAYILLNSHYRQLTKAVMLKVKPAPSVSLLALA